MVRELVRNGTNSLENVIDRLITNSLDIKMDNKNCVNDLKIGIQLLEIKMSRNGSRLRIGMS